MAPATGNKRSAVAAMAAAAVMAALPTARADIVRGMDLCTSYARVCSDIVSQVDCRSHFDGIEPKPILATQSCAHGAPETYMGQCKCAGLDAGAIVLQELVDYSVTFAMPSIVQPSKTTENATDYGATYVKACTTFLSGARCPAGLQQAAGYGAKGGFSDFRGDCLCGGIDASHAVRDTVNAHLLKRKQAATTVTLPAADGATAPGGELDMCGTFDAMCSTFLEDIACPTALRANRGCTTPTAAETLAGECRCGAMDASEAVKEALMGLALPTAEVEAAKVYTAESVAAAAAGQQQGQTVEPTVEYCGTYKNVCTAFLTKAGIAPELQEAAPGCNGGAGTNLATFRGGRCVGGDLDMSAAVNGFLVGQSVEQDLPELVCLGNECQPRLMSPGVMAVLIIVGCLAGVLLLLFACVRGEDWARACMANSLVATLLMPCGCLFRRNRAKESPQVTDHAVNLKGMMA